MKLPLSIPFALALAAALPAPRSHAQVDPGRLDAVSIEWLKATYLACDRITRAQRVPAAIAERCGEIADQLRLRAFGGDFERLIAWWEAERRVGEAAATAAAGAERTSL